MNQQASITVLMSAYARAFHAENDPRLPSAIPWPAS